MSNKFSVEEQHLIVTEYENGTKIAEIVKMLNDRFETGRIYQSIRAAVKTSKWYGEVREQLGGKVRTEDVSESAPVVEEKLPPEVIVEENEEPVEMLDADDPRLSPQNDDEDELVALNDTEEVVDPDPEDVDEADNWDEAEPEEEDETVEMQDLENEVEHVIPF